MRGAKHIGAIQAVVAAFGEQAEGFVFVGGCVLGLYARSEGAPLRMTEDVDCISSLIPWSRQEKILADLCSAGVIDPDEKLMCRYRIRGAAVDVDVLSPEGFNVGGVNPWFARAVTSAARYSIGQGATVRAVTPPYFLATKLVAFVDRGLDETTSKDAEDIVALAVEVPSLVDEVGAAGLRADVAGLWERVFDRYKLECSDLADLVSWHLHPDDGAHRDRVIRTLMDLAGCKDE